MKGRSQVPTDVIVYIVDDDEAIRKSLSMLLKSSGYNSRACASAAEFLECYDSSIPTCLLLDVGMAGMSGPELQQKLAKDGITIPIIFMSGHAEMSAETKAHDFGEHEFLEKPFLSPDLFKRIDSCIERAIGT
jgi:FixJ family two-component response regulator